MHIANVVITSQLFLVDCPGTKKNVQKNVQKVKPLNIFLLLFPFCPMAIPGYFGMGQAFKIPSRGKISKSRPGLFRVLSLSRCPFVPGIEWASVPLSLIRTKS